MTINVDELKILVIEKENIDIYYDFAKLVAGGGDYSKEELLEILNDGGQIFMFKYHNVIASSCIFFKPKRDVIDTLGIDEEYDKVIQYGELYVFEDFDVEEIKQYMINRLNTMCKRLGYTVAIGKLHSSNDASCVNLQTVEL